MLSKFRVSTFDLMNLLANLLIFSLLALTFDIVRDGVNKTCYVSVKMCLTLTRALVQLMAITVVSQISPGP